MEGLLTELGDLSRRNDELMTAKDADLIVIRDLDNQLKDYKRKYEQAKTELRSVKGVSFFFPVRLAPLTLPIKQRRNCFCKPPRWTGQKISYPYPATAACSISTSRPSCLQSTACSPLAAPTPRPAF
jgi:hypothetical protein